jgi:hypothetical protein
MGKETLRGSKENKPVREWCSPCLSLLTLGDRSYRH